MGGAGRSRQGNACSGEFQSIQPAGLLSAQVMPTLITCTCCAGSGKEELSPRLERAFGCVPKRQTTTAKEVSVKLGIKHMDACHALADLLLLGLVTQRHITDGVVWHYSRKEAK